MKSLTVILATTLALGTLWCGPTTAEPPPAHHHDMAGTDDMAAPASIPGASLYQLSLTLEAADGSTHTLAELRGKPLLLAMFYSHCTSVCPLLTTQLQRLTRALTPDERQKLRVLMVSFDSKRDTPAALSEFKALHHIDDGNWLVTRGSAGDVRTLAAALGIRYRELPDQGFSHSAVITLLDAAGVARARTQTIAGEDPAFLAALTELLR
jgi:protein SCO1/2